MNNSIARYLLLRLALMLALAGLILVQLGLFWLDHSLRQHTGQQLQQQAESLLFSLIRDEDDALVVNERHHDAQYLKPFSGQYFIIQINDEEFRSRSLWDFAWPEQQPDKHQLFPGPNRQQLLSYQATYHMDDSEVVVTVAEDYQPVLERFYSLRNWGLVGAALLLVLIGLLQWRLISRALRPLELARQQLQELESGQRQQLDEQVPEEMQSLVRQINQLLLHIDEQLKRSRRATGNLGHALKTPLAVLNSLQDRPELQQHPELARLLFEQLGLIDRRIERELNRARMAGEQHGRLLFICNEEIPTLLQLMRQVHGTDIEFIYLAKPDLQLPFDRDDLLELLGNLLDNAGKLAKQKVQLQLQVTGQQLLISVDDDGSGIAPQQRQQLLQRGQRADEQTPGHGLGLAIVQDITSALHGTLELQDSELGGLQVTIGLPLLKS